MAPEKDTKNRDELKNLVQESRLPKEEKDRLMKFIDILENGNLDKLLKEIKDKLQN